MQKPDYRVMREETESAGWNIHDDYKGLSLDELQNVVSKDRLPFSVMCLNITGSLNVGNIIRTAHCLGAENVYVVGRRTIDNRSLVGADKYFSVNKINAVDAYGYLDIDLINNLFGELKLNPIFIETGGQNYTKYNWFNLKNVPTVSNQICLIVGNEGMGIPKELMQYRSVVSIPQKGVIRSLNVSSAFAIVCSHMVNQLWS